MDRFYVISNSMKDPEGKIAKEIKAYLNFRGKQCIIQERQGKESLRSYKYTNANLIPPVPHKGVRGSLYFESSTPPSGVLQIDYLFTRL